MDNQSSNTAAGTASDKVQGMNIVMHGITINGPMFDIHDNHTVVIQQREAPASAPAATPVAKCDTPKADVPFDRIVRAAEACQSYFWAQSSWAVVYCVCRDHLGMDMTMSEFERRVAEHPLKPKTKPCPEGTVRKAFSNNPDMNAPIHRWPEDRARILASELVKALGG